MVGHRELVRGRCDPDEQESQQRCGGHIEVASLIRGQCLGDGSVALDPVEMRQIDRVPRQTNVLLDDLHRLTVSGRGERGTQIVVPVQQCLRRVVQPFGVHLAGQIEYDLHGVDVDRRVGEQCVEQQPLLQRRQRPDVGQLRVASLERCDLGLRERNQRHIRWGQATGAGCLGVRGQRRQRLGPQPGETLDRVGGHGSGRECEARAQDSTLVGVEHDRVDVDRLVRGHVGVAGRGELTVGGRQPAEGLHLVRDLACVDPTQVVEADLSGSEFGQFRSGLGAQVPEQPPAHASIGQREHLLLDCLDGLAELRSSCERGVDIDSGQVETDREQARQPADGASQISSGNHRFLAAVALELHQSCRCSDSALGPQSRDGHSEPGQQPVAHTTAEDLRNGGQQGAGDVGRQFDIHPFDSGHDVDRGIERAIPQYGILGVGDRAPQWQLGLSRLARRRVHQCVRPTPHRGSDRGEGRDHSPGHLCPGGDEIGNEDAPRHTVDHEVVSRDGQRSGLLGSAIDPDEGEHASGRGVERSDRIVEYRCSRIAVGPDQDGIHIEETDVRDVETPAPVVVYQRRSQHVVTIDHSGHRGEDSGPIDTDRQFEGDGLMET